MSNLLLPFFLTLECWSNLHEVMLATSKLPFWDKLNFVGGGGVGKEVEEMTVYIMEVFIETKFSFSSKSVPIMFVFKRQTHLILLIRGKLAETNNPLSSVIFH